MVHSGFIPISTPMGSGVTPIIGIPTTTPAVSLRNQAIDPNSKVPLPSQDSSPLSSSLLPLPPLLFPSVSPSPSLSMASYSKNAQLPEEVARTVYVGNLNRTVCERKRNCEDEYECEIVNINMNVHVNRNMNMNMSMNMNRNMNMNMNVNMNMNMNNVRVSE